MDAFIWILLLGMLIGLSSTFIGVGGGILIVPLLPLVHSLSVRELIATSLFSVFCVAIMNTYGFSRRGLVEWKKAFTLGLGSMTGAFFAAKMTAYVSPRVILWGFFVVVCLLAFRTLFAHTLKSDPGSSVSSQGQMKQLILIGLGGGTIMGFTGVGGGSLFASMLVAFHLVEDGKVSPTANAALVLTSGSAALAYLGSFTAIEWPRAGLIHLDASLLLCAGAWFSAMMGRKYQHHMPGYWRSRVLGAVMFLMAIKVGVMAWNV